MIKKKSFHPNFVFVRVYLERTAQLMLALVASMVLMDGALGAGKLAEEVLALPKPEPFIPTPVGDIVKKYIAPGMTKSRSVEVLKQQGFKITESSRSSGLKDCPACENNIVDARFDHRPWYSFFYDYAITIRLGYKDGYVAFVESYYVKSMP